MLRQLPATVTADATPDWLPVGWIVHSTVLKRGRQTRTYTQLRTGKKFYTKDHVLEYIKMEKVREERESGIKKKKLNALQDSETARERPSWLPDDSKPEERTGSGGGIPYQMNVNTPDGFKTHVVEENVLSYETSMDSEDSSGEDVEIDCNQIAYVIEEDEEDFSESEFVENFSNLAATTLRSQPERVQKLESRAKTQRVFEDEEDMSTDSDNKLLPEAETSKEENATGDACVESNPVESFEEKNLHGFMVVCDDKARELPGLIGSLTVEINLDCEPASDSLVEKAWNKSEIEGTGTRNIEIIDLESDQMHISASSEVVEVTQESGDTSEEPLKAQVPKEETANELRRSVFFPYREAPSRSVLVFDNSNAGSSAEDLINTIELGLNTPEKNIRGSDKRKKSMKECSAKNFKKKDTEAPIKKPQKGKNPPSKPQGKKGSLSEKKPDDWPEPCPNFAFEPLTTSCQVEDDSVIRRYLEQHFTAPWSADSNLPLPDFGLPSFSNIIITLNEEPESKKKKSPDPPCIQVASSSFASCSSTGTTMQQTVAGN